MSEQSRASVTIQAGDITLTGKIGGAAGWQVKLNDNSYIYFTKEAAAQWLPVIQQIAAEEK